MVAKKNVARAQTSRARKKYLCGNIETSEGVKLWACMRGYRGSSTRAEIAAIILAMLTPNAIHVATDSNNAKLGFEKLIAYIQEQDIRENNENHYEEWPMGKHWSLINDGDLWQQAWSILLQRGQASFRISKVKGHARDIDVQHSQELAEHKKGNDIADDAADLGLESNGNGKAAYGSYLHRRQEAYTKLVGEIQTMLVEVLKLSIEKRQQQRKKKDPVKGSTKKKIKEKSLLPEGSSMKIEMLKY